MADKLPDFAYCPFTIIIDTREQAPFGFRDIDQLKRYGGGPLVIKAERGTLKTGDYSIKGMESRIAVERKELNDLLGCIGGDRERFEKQLERLNEMEFACMMIEATYDMVIRTAVKETKLTQDSVIGSLVAWPMDYYPRVHWFFCGGKRLAELTTFRILDRWWRNHEV